MFSAIADRYDLMNRLMTMGQDESWRRQVAAELNIPDDGLVLDVAAGTGDIARRVALIYPHSRVVALDFCADMLQAGRYKFEGHAMMQANPLHERVKLVCGDAMLLPYRDQTFHGVATGFALRNVVDISHALREMWRVLRPGRRMVCLEISRPPWRLIANAYWWYFFKVVPFLGGIISGQREAYSYLPRSAQAFLSAEQLREAMEAVGFRRVRFRRLMLGTVAIHVGEKD
jgi:demethylmenaquinone methyltransferase/2-methoxy-6-polyprenyl-1,4-benzoquinol methylase